MLQIFLAENPEKITPELISEITTKGPDVIRAKHIPKLKKEQRDAISIAKVGDDVQKELMIEYEELTEKQKKRSCQFVTAYTKE